MEKWAVELENRKRFADLKFDFELEKWICECGAEYGAEIPKPNYCMKCKRMWLKNDVQEM